MKNGSLMKEEEGNNSRIHFENALVIEMEKEVKKEVESLWRKKGAALPKKDDDDDADNRLWAENRRLRV